MSLFQVKDGGRRVSLRLHLFVSDLDPVNKYFICKRVVAKIFLRGPKDFLDRKGFPRLPASF